MTLNISLIDGYRLLSDKHQYILAKEEADRITHLAFCSNMEGCIKSLIDRKIRGFNSKSFHELQVSIKGLQTRLNKALLPLDLCVESKNKEVKS